MSKKNAKKKNSAPIPVQDFNSGTCDTPLVRLVKEYEDLKESLRAINESDKEIGESLQAARINYETVTNHKTKQLDHNNRIRRSIEASLANVSELIVLAR